MLAHVGYLISVLALLHIIASDQNNMDYHYYEHLVKYTSWK